MHVFFFAGTTVVVGALIGTSLPVWAAKPLPPGATAVIHAVHTAAGQQRHAALQRLMAPPVPAPTVADGPAAAAW